jgi:Ca2+-binding RTX toxin-like protein
MVGGDGDDTLVWNNGDGTDTANGDAGQDTTEVNGAPGAGDAFTVAPDGQRVRFERTNLGPFSIDMLTESLDLNALGGDDTLSVANGAAVHVDADGGSGADALTGSDGDETLRGGSGNDTLKGGTGSDTLDGGDGDDAIDARDAAGDLVRCGTGTDRATLDAASVDPQTGCETVDRSPEGAVAPRFGAVLVRATRVPARGRRVRIPLRCPANPAGGCRGELILQTAKPVRAGGPRAVVRLGSARFTLPAGRAGAATIRLPAGFALLAPAGAKTLAARIRLYNRGGVFQSRRLAITLPKRAR